MVPQEMLLDRDPLEIDHLLADQAGVSLDRLLQVLGPLGRTMGVLHLEMEVHSLDGAQHLRAEVAAALPLLPVELGGRNRRVTAGGTADLLLLRLPDHRGGGIGDAAPPADEQDILMVRLRHKDSTARAIVLLPRFDHFFHLSSLSNYVAAFDFFFSAVIDKHLEVVLRLPVTMLLEMQEHSRLVEAHVRAADLAAEGPLPCLKLDKLFQVGVRTVAVTTNVSKEQFLCALLLAAELTIKLFPAVPPLVEGFGSTAVSSVGSSARWRAVFHGVSRLLHLAVVLLVELKQIQSVGLAAVSAPGPRLVQDVFITDYALNLAGLLDVRLAVQVFVDLRLHVVVVGDVFPEQGVDRGLKLAQIALELAGPSHELLQGEVLSG